MVQLSITSIRYNVVGLCSRHQCEFLYAQKCVRKILYKIKRLDFNIKYDPFNRFTLDYTHVSFTSVHGTQQALDLGL